MLECYVYIVSFFGFSSYLAENSLSYGELLSYMHASRNVPCLVPPPPPRFLSKVDMHMERFLSGFVCSIL
jgi:hypothetical protein